MQSDLRFGAYECLATEGTENKLVLSFAGIGDFVANKMAYEWKRTLDQVTKAHVIYVKDQSRTWYNHSSGFDEIIAFIKDYIAKHQITEVTAIGLSMGAYGALTWSKYIDCTRVISISNRFSLSASLGDLRNVEFIEAMQPARFPDVLECPNPKTDYLFFFSLDDHSDMKHLSLAAKHGFYGRIYAYRGNHNLGVSLDRYRPHFIKAVIEGNEAPLPDSGFMRIDEEEALLLQTLTTLNSVSAWDHYLAANPAPPDHFIPKSLMRHHDAAMAKRKSALLETVYTPETLPPYLIDGWSRPEKTGVWSVGPSHVLSMRLADAPFAKRIEVRLDVRPFLPAGITQQRVNIRVNGKMRERFLLEEKQSSVLSFIVESRSNLELVIETPDCASPKTLGISSDTRDLALFLRSIQIRKVWTA